MLELLAMLLREGILDHLGLPRLGELELVEILIELSNLIHEPLILPVLVPHLHRVLLEKPILLKLNLLQSLHLLRNLTLQPLLQRQDHPTALIDNIGQLVILG